MSGLVVGSFAVGPLLKYGRRKTIIFMNILAAFAIVPTLFRNLVSILIGKFIFGLASGCLIVACSIYQNEIVPAEKAYWFGFTTNFGVIIGITICLVMGFALPDPSTDEKAAEETNFWIVILCIPEAIIALCLPLWICVFRNESIKFSLDHGDEQDARAMIKKIYSEDTNSLITMTYDDIYQKLDQANK